MSSTLALSVFACIFFFFGIRFIAEARNKWNPAPGANDAEFWKKMAENLFHRSSRSPEIPEVRLEQLLTATAERLGLRYGFIFIHRGERCRLVSKAVCGYANASTLRPGDEIAREKIYCSLLSEQRPVIAIDVASLSEWRRHSACTELGWETYIGAHISLGAGLTASVAFTDSRPRDKLFSRAEREFVRQLGKWVSQLLADEVAAAQTHEAVGQFVGVS